MGYMADFVGLVNFFDEKGKGKGKRLLLPNGTTLPSDKIRRHYADIFVLTREVADSAAWPAETDSAMKKIKVSRFAISQPATITLSGQDGSGRLDTTKQDGMIPLLKVIDSKIDIQPDKAATIAQIEIDSGTLEAFLLGKGSVVSRLTLKFGDLLTITMRPNDGSASKTLFIRDGAEIVIANTSRIGDTPPKDEENHFKIYGQLDVKRDGSRLKEPPHDQALDQLPSAHPYIAFLRDSEGTIPLPGCSVSGCCACCEP